MDSLGIQSLIPSNLKIIGAYGVASRSNSPTTINVGNFVVAVFSFTHVEAHPGSGAYAYIPINTTFFIAPKTSNSIEIMCYSLLTSNNGPFHNYVSAGYITSTASSIVFGQYNGGTINGTLVVYS